MEQGKAVRFWHKGADRMERLGACCDGDLRHACAALPQRLRGPVVVLFLNDEEDFTDAGAGSILRSVGFWHIVSAAGDIDCSSPGRALFVIDTLCRLAGNELGHACGGRGGYS